MLFLFSFVCFSCHENDLVVPEDLYKIILKASGNPHQVNIESSHSNWRLIKHFASPKIVEKMILGEWDGRGGKKADELSRRCLGQCFHYPTCENHWGSHVTRLYYHVESRLDAASYLHLTVEEVLRDLTKNGLNGD